MIYNWHSLCLINSNTKTKYGNTNMHIQPKASSALHPLQRFLCALLSARAGVHLQQQQHE